MDTQPKWDSHWNTLQHTTTHCNALQHTTTHCNTLQHIATNCNTLQHTATLCNTGGRLEASHTTDTRTNGRGYLCQRLSCTGVPHIWKKYVFDKIHFHIYSASLYGSVHIYTYMLFSYIWAIGRGYLYLRLPCTSDVVYIHVYCAHIFGQTVEVTCAKSYSAMVCQISEKITYVKKRILTYIQPVYRVRFMYIHIHCFCIFWQTVAVTCACACAHEGLSCSGTSNMSKECTYIQMKRNLYTGCVYIKINVVTYIFFPHNWHNHPQYWPLKLDWHLVILFEKQIFKIEKQIFDIKKYIYFI